MSTKEYSKQIHNILTAYRELSVPLRKCLPLLFKSVGVSIEQVTNDAGYSKDAFYKALRRNNRPKYPLLQSIINHLGVDPWAVYEDTGDNGATRE